MPLIKKIKRKLTYYKNDILFTIGFKKNNPSKHIEKAIILIYHGIDQAGSTKYNSRFISQKTLEKHIRYFSENFNIISLDDYYNQKFDDDKLNVCLTFDDGYRNNYKYAVPILEKYQTPATFFITAIRSTNADYLWTDYIDMASHNYHKPIFIGDEVFKKGRHNEYYSQKSGISLKNRCKQEGYDWKKKAVNALPDDFRKENKYDDYWQLLTQDEIKVLSSNKLFTIGSHGSLHDCLGIIDIGSAKKDILDSKQFLESILGQPIDAIAFPDGSYTREVVDFCKSIGLDKQLAVDYLFDEDQKDKGIEKRFGINPHISWNNQLNCILKSKYY